MHRLFSNRSYFDYLIAVVTVIAIIFLFKELVSIGDDKKRSDEERSQEVSRLMKNFVRPPHQENRAQPAPVIVTQNVVVVKTVYANAAAKPEPIKDLDEDVNPVPEKNAPEKIVTRKVFVVKTVAVKVTETAAVTQFINQ